MNSNPTCDVTHRQIAYGTCPWCETQITALPDDADLVWDIGVLESDLDDETDEVRILTVVNLMRHKPAFRDLVPLLSKALNDSCATVVAHACHGLVGLGRKLAIDQVPQVEADLNSTNCELALRILLVGYYFLGHRESQQAEAMRRSHILWLIGNAPENEVCGSPDCLLLRTQDPSGYEQGRQVWLSQVKSTEENTKVLANAAAFFTLNDSTLAEQLLKRGQTLEPGVPYWAEQLGHLYSLKSHRKDLEGVAAKSFAAFAAAENIRDTPGGLADGETDGAIEILLRINSLASLAKSAFDALEIEQAANYASELLSLADSVELPEYFRDDGNAIHVGNLVLGRIALQSGDVEQAKRRLLASGRAKEEPNLMTFGPNMSLALELLRQGERQVVLEYFELCSKFWKRRSDRLESWSSEVRQGEIPDFGANLRY